MSDSQAAVSLPEPPPTAEDVDRRWRGYCAIEVMIRNPNVNEIIGSLEAERDRLWKLVGQIAAQTDPAWALKLAKRAIAEREA